MEFHAGLSNRESILCSNYLLYALPSSASRRILVVSAARTVGRRTNEALNHILADFKLTTKLESLVVLANDIRRVQGQKIHQSCNGSSITLFSSARVCVPTAALSSTSAFSFFLAMVFVVVVVVVAMTVVVSVAPALSSSITAVLPWSFSRHRVSFQSC